MLIFSNTYQNLFYVGGWMDSITLWPPPNHLKLNGTWLSWSVLVKYGKNPKQAWEAISSDKVGFEENNILESVFGLFIYFLTQSVNF